MRFSLAIVKYGVHPHSRCFEDVMFALHDALTALGHEVVDHTDPNPGRLLICGGNNLFDPDAKMPPDAIIFNTEQLAAFDDPKSQMGNYEQYRRHVVWDYSKANIEALRGLGIARAVHCPIGYAPSMMKTWRGAFGLMAGADADIDVLFYGALSERRSKVLSALHAAGLRTGRLKLAFGRERDEVIARSKVVLNMHFYERGVFEIFRCSHLFANRACVVSEAGGLDAELEALAERATKYVPLDGIVDACRALCADAGARREVAERGYAAFAATSLADNVRRAIEESDPFPGVARSKNFRAERLTVEEVKS